MLPTNPTLTQAAADVLNTASPLEKVRLTRLFAAQWQDGAITQIGDTPPPPPARPERPVVLPPAHMPKRTTGGSKGRGALLHALAHIELNAIDLAWDMAARFVDQDWPVAFYDDWVQVAVDEALHFELLAQRMEPLSVSYGDLPAHGGLWEAAEKTAHDPLARLAVIPMTHEARGLDTTPSTTLKLRRAGDGATADALEIIYRDEIRHVAAGCRWFKHLCAHRKLEPVETYKDQLRRYFPGGPKPPFNAEARAEAGMEPEFYCSD